MALVLNHQTKAQFAARLRARFKAADKAEACRIAAWVLDHIEADDARLLHAMLRVIKGGSFESINSIGLDMDEDVDDEHKASFSHAVFGCFGVEYSID